VNIGYFSPAWYRLYHQFDVFENLEHLGRDWSRILDRNYDILNKSPGYPLGLVPDWMSPEGSFVSDVGYNTYGGGEYMYKDAIRTLWRIGTDVLWNHDPRGEEYMERAYQFIQQNRGGIHHADFFDMNGNPLPAPDVWIFDGGQRQRPRREHSVLTVGMWVFPIWIQGTEKEKAVCIEELMSFYDPEEGYWGLKYNPLDPGEDIDHNEMYFEEFMAEFAALLMAEKWTLD
jgi:hypothetical protein